MEIFKIFGTIGLKGVEETNKSLNETAKKGQQTSNTLQNAFARIGKAVLESFKPGHTRAFGKSLDEVSAAAKEQRTKLNALKEKYKSLYLEQGKNSKETKNCAKEIKELSAELAKNENAMDKAEDAANKLDKSLRDVGDSADKSESKLSRFFGAIGRWSLKMVGVGLAAAGTAILSIGKKAVEAYSDYEQFVGGVKTLFGTQEMTLEEYAKSVGKTVEQVKDKYSALEKAQNMVMTNAANAYKSAGMSANEYMDTVTSFSASLISSLKGDTVKAAEIADRAIIDMADNANKMGTSLESIQNAYQGFAKQNYTMLDNLKLGYGGTKEEMERLIADASKMKDAQKELGITVDASSMSFANIANAISVVQKNMGIANTTANEAASTIQGSLASLKASWTNLMTGLTDETQDFDTLMKNLFDSLVTVGNNLIPRIGVVLDGIVEMVVKLAPKIAEAIPGIISQILPKVVEGATKLVKAVADILPQLLDSVLKAIPNLISGLEQIFKSLIDAFPKALESLLSKLPTLIPQIVNALTNMCVYVMKHFAGIIQPLIDKLPDIIISLVDALMNNLPTLIDGCIQLIIGIVKATPKILLGLIKAIPNIVGSVVNGLWDALPIWIEGIISILGETASAIWEFFTGLAEQISEWFSWIWEKIKEIFAPVVEWFASIFSAAWEAIKSAWNAVVEWFSGIWDGIVSVFSAVGEWFGEVFGGAWENVKGVWNAVTGWFSGLWEGIKNVFKGVGNFFSNVFKGAFDGIKKVFGSIGDWFKKIFDKIAAVVKAPINFVIKGLNMLIRGLNKISFDIPDWVPVIGGKKFGFNIGAIPLLAKGGVVDKSTIANIGEDGAEAVVPLEKNTEWIEKIADKLKDALGARNDDSVLSKFDELIIAIKSLKIYLNNGVLVGELAPAMDSALGNISRLRGRGL